MKSNQFIKMDDSQENEFKKGALGNQEISERKSHDI
jgi:hypothetical protein